MTLEPLTSAEPEALPDQLPQPNPDANARHASLVTDRLAVFHTEFGSRAGVQIPSEDPRAAMPSSSRQDCPCPHRNASTSADLSANLSSRCSESTCAIGQILVRGRISGTEQVTTWQLNFPRP
jgi:hypothetical protein